jgi:dTMP kinase
MQGFFITFEGCEGAGKSTLSEKIYQALLEKKIPAIRTHEPGGTKVSEKIRELLLSKDSTLAPMTEVMLYLASRAQHVQEIIGPALENGKVVLCDRFSDATIAYQGYGRGIDIPTLLRMNDFITNGLRPQHTVLLDIDPRIGLERSKRLSKASAPQGELDRIESESLAFHDAIRKGYLEIAKCNTERITMYDASQPLIEIFPQILLHLLTVIQKHALS